MKRNNFIISFSGVDGAGKTTILKMVKEKLFENDVKVIELRSRPSILPILSAVKYGKTRAEAKVTDTLPRKGENSSKISSYLRFFYYLTDYILGQFYIYFRYIRRGYVVFYDRFYFDYITDSKRSNLIITPRVALFFLRFIKEPDLNIFLYAPSKIILERKKELDAATIQSLTNDYLTLFDHLAGVSKSQYLCIENIDLRDTISTIDEYLQGNLL